MPIKLKEENVFRLKREIYHHVTMETLSSINFATLLCPPIHAKLLKTFNKKKTQKQFVEKNLLKIC